MSLEI